MRREGRRPWGPVRSSRFPPLLFSIIFVGTLLASGVHMGLIVLMNTLHWSNLVQTGILGCGIRRADAVLRADHQKHL